ncbi:hypothetical protein GCM10010389_63180 [Streptomyces echinoruber]|uniref:Integral membrane protein n=2 Tax=Streptomyces echinoruber TaxID=68898 RepID=A0A918RX70_9ACTN|nr:hypothetical protein GCM10010389_63180 [Streptomyces echinoruber]
MLRAAVFAAVCVVLAAAGHALASCATVPLWTLGAGFAGTVVVVAPLAGRERSLPGIVALLAAGQIVLHTLFGLGQAGTAAGGTLGGTSMASLSTVSTSTVSMSTVSMSTANPAVSDAALVRQAARLLCGAPTAAISPAQARRVLLDARLHPGGTSSGTLAHHPADALAGATGSAFSPAALLPSLPMLLGHLLAALAAGWLLRRGDRALLRLLELSAHSVAEGALVGSLRGALALARVLYAGLPTVPEPGAYRWRTAPPAPPALRTTALQHTVIRRGPPAALVPAA